MRRLLLLAATAFASQPAVLTAAEAPITSAPLALAIRALDEDLQAQTVEKMQQLVERDVAGLTRALLGREATRVVAVAAPDSGAPSLAPFEG